MVPCRFWLGTQEPHWLGLTDAPLFLSRRRLARRQTVPRALGLWSLDSGGFSELSLFGRWTVRPEEYIAEVRKWRSAAGGLLWCAQMDWMCEPSIRSKTGLTTRDHQERTVANYLELTRLAPDLPWVPVLQGWEWGEYLTHLAMWKGAGVELAVLPLVGLGSVCRRQATGMVDSLVRHLAGLGLRLHGFGLKAGGLRRCARYLASADSMAWSFRARLSPPLPGCRHRHCDHCLRYALAWRARVLRSIDAGLGLAQTTLWD
jgi:hypothetical protein